MWAFAVPSPLPNLVQWGSPSTRVWDSFPIQQSLGAAASRPRHEVAAALGHAERHASSRLPSELSGTSLALVTVAGVRAWSRRRHSRRVTALGATDSSASLGKFVKTHSEYPDERPKTGDLVRIHYVGRLEDGRVFDSSRARGQPFEFNLGESQVIDGWDMLIGTMALGERADLVIPAEYAYGEEGIPPVVPPGATLTYDVELLDIGRPIVDDSEPEEEAAAEVAAEVPESKEPELFWEKDPEREAGRGVGYTWEATGTGAEICISLPLSASVKVKEIAVDVKTLSMTCKIAREVAVEGELFAAVDSDDSHWDIERKDGNINLLIYLAKLDTAQKWDSLFKGGDTVESPALETEVIDVDEALRIANEQSRRRADAGRR